VNSILSSAADSRGAGSKNDAADPVVCFTNIGPKEQRKRLVFGMFAFAAGLALAALLVSIHANAWWRVALFVPFVGAGIGYFQARDKT